MVLDWVTKKQLHVCRATFTAELNALLEAVNHGLRILAVLTEIENGTRTAAQLCEIQDTAQFVFPLEACCDARSVFEAAAALNAPRPADAHVTLHVLKLREWLKQTLLSILWWVDTRDMVADGMTKGTISRLAIIELAEKCNWILQHPVARYPKGDR